METVAELKRRIAIIEAEEGKKCWNEWYEKGKVFLENLKGRAFIWKGNEYSAQFFKVVDVKTQGVWGVKGPGYFAVATDGYFIIHSAKSFSRGIDMHYGTDSPYGTFVMSEPKFKVKNKSVVSQLTYREGSLSDTVCLNTSRVTHYGKYTINEKGHTEFKDSYRAQSSLSPFMSVAEEFMKIGIFEVPIDVYEEAKDITNQVAVLTNDYWKRNEKSILEAKRVTA